MTIFVVTEMNEDMTYKRIHGATTDRETAVNMAEVVLRTRLKGNLDEGEFYRYVNKEVAQFNRFTKWGMNCIDTLNTVQITMFDD